MITISCLTQISLLHHVALWSKYNTNNFEYDKHCWYQPFIASGRVACYTQLMLIKTPLKEIFQNPKWDCQAVVRRPSDPGRRQSAVIWW